MKQSFSVVHTLKLYFSKNDITDTLQSEVDNILGIEWQFREAHLFPESEEIALANGAFKIEATFPYADLADVSLLSEKCSWETSAKIIRAYLDISARLILAHGGLVRSAGGTASWEFSVAKQPIHRR